MAIPLRSVSSAILDRLPRGPLRGWTVLSVHRRACNLRSPQGTVLGLVSPELGNGPFHAVLAQPVDFAWLAQGLTQGGLALDLVGAAAWDPWLGERELEAENWETGVGRRKLGVGSQKLGDGSHPPLYPVARALRAGDPASLRTAVLALAGRGPGLTPAGDDFLLGIMAGLWLFPEPLSPRWTVPEACQRIVDVAASRTTTLSAAWLRAAGQGAFGQPWHALAEALALDDPARLARAVEGILAVGATSGQDALTGFLAWVDGSPEARPAPTSHAAP